MKNNRKIFCSERLPDIEGWYETSIGIIFLAICPPGIGFKPGPHWQYGQTPQWWINKSVTDEKE